MTPSRVSVGNATVSLGSREVMRAGMVFIAVLVAFAGWAVATHGSLRHAWLHASGVRLLVEPARIDVGEGKPGETREATFTVRNLSGIPVRLLGARASCSCLATDRLPISIPPAGSIELHISIHLETSTTGTVEQSVHYRTDLPAVPEFVAVVVGHVSKG